MGFGGDAHVFRKAIPGIQQSGGRLGAIPPDWEIECYWILAILPPEASRKGQNAQTEEGHGSGGGDWDDGGVVVDVSVSQFQFNKSGITRNLEPIKHEGE